MITKKVLCAALEEKLVEMYPWAQDKQKLDNFMGSFRRTIAGKSSFCTVDGDALKAAWKDLGGKGKITYKALRALPDE